MKKFEIFVGLRYFQSKKSSKFISFVTGISIIGTAIGVMAIIVVLSVMNGFQNTVRNKIINTGFHVYLTSYGRSSSVYNYDDIMKQIKQKEGDKVEVTTPFYKSQAIIKSSMQRIMGIDFQGIEPDLFKKR